MGQPDGSYTPAPPSAGSPPANAQPADTFGAAPTANQGNASGGPASLDEQLSSLEAKVYGKKQDDMTLMQRMEKLEKELTGKTRSGTIIERMDYLKRTFGN
jgi:hypothetical protein